MKYLKVKLLITVFLMLMPATGCSLLGGKFKPLKKPMLLKDNFSEYGLSQHYIWQLKSKGNYLYAGADSRLYRHTIGDSTGWEMIGPSHHQTLTFAFFPGHDIIAEEAAEIYRTMDDGKTWQNYQNGFGGNYKYKEYPTDLTLDPITPILFMRKVTEVLWQNQLITGKVGVHYGVHGIN